MVGIRPGEKIHEEMITSTDAQNTIETPSGYIIVPTPSSGVQTEISDRYAKHHSGAKVATGFSYSSGTNNDFLSIDALGRLIDSQLNQDDKI